jgi:hypothetical protein
MYDILVGKPLGRQPIGRWNTWEDKLKITFRMQFPVIWVGINWLTFLFGLMLFTT